MKEIIYLIKEEDYYDCHSKVKLVTKDLRLALMKIKDRDMELSMWLDNEEVESFYGSCDPKCIKSSFEKSIYLNGYHDDLIKEAVKILDEYDIEYEKEKNENERNKLEEKRRIELAELARLKAIYETT